VDVGEVSIESAISLLPTGEGGFTLAASLNVSIPGVSDRDSAVALVRAAHEVCPYSNATRGNVDVELLLDGEAL
jgi:osmotically inducible protein OsmC